MNAHNWIIPDWPAPAHVKALITTREGGVSKGVYASFNLGDHVGDEPAAVRQNRKLLRKYLPSDPKWLIQVHGPRVASVDGALYAKEADAAVARVAGTVCAVLTADCLPLLLCDDAGKVVAAVHAGWRGLRAGVIQAAVKAMMVPPAALMAYLGPAIGPQSYEVGDDVRDAFVNANPEDAPAFAPESNGKWLADLYSLARQRLSALGVTRVYGGAFCTYREADKFFSYRRDGETGRMASLIWLERP